MKIKKQLHIGIWALCLVIIFSIRQLPWAGEFYSQHIYPGIAKILRTFSNVFPFSIGDCFIFCGSLFLIGYLFYSLFSKGKRKKRVGKFILWTGWIYIWFYFAWGLNYFREGFYTRNQIPYAAYDSLEFTGFLTEYISALNESYTPEPLTDNKILEEEIISGYKEIRQEFILNPVGKRLKRKHMLFSPLMSKMGISGYMGPFFCEFNLNSQNRPEEYPAVYAHEVAHILGITNEAEANLYAFLVCSKSDVAEIRYSGYFSLFGYAMGNAKYLLSPEEFDFFYDSIRPEVKIQYAKYINYWRRKYEPAIGKFQSRIYDLFLKGNKISSGTKNYSEVIGMLQAYLKSKREE